MQLTQGLRRAVQCFPNRTSTVFGDRRRTWTETHERVTRLAAGLAAIGTQPGDRVAIIAGNSDYYVEAVYALLWAGCVIVPGNTRWAPGEHAYAMQDSTPSYLLVDANFVEMARRLPGFDPDKTVFMGEDAPADLVSFDKLIEDSQPLEDRCTHDDALAVIMYTGGTTGWPKGVMMSHRNIIMAFTSFHLVCHYEPEPVILHSAPMFHQAALSCVFSFTSVGATQVILPAFDPVQFIEKVVTEKVNSALVVPTMVDVIDRCLQAKPTDMSCLRKLFYGASPISEALLRRAMKSLPNAGFYQGYGQTELAGGLVVLPADYHCVEGPRAKLLRAAGRAVPWTEVRIVDEEMNEVPRGNVGEVVARGPTVMLGYWRKPEQTEATIVNGWLRTGDAGYMDEDGFIFLVDRVKDMIVSGGENVYSAEVENALAQHPAILECSVIGIPDDKWGEAVHAIVRLREGHEVSAEDLTAHCAELIAGYKKPRSYTFRTDPLPLSAVGKVLKTELRKPFWEGRERRVA